MKKLILLSLMLMLSTGAWAQDATQRLVVWLADGTKVYHDLKDQPETTFENGALYLRTEKVSVSYPIEKVLRYTFDGHMPAIGIEVVKPGEVRFSQGNDQMRFDGLAAGTKLELYTLDGKLINTQTAANGQPSIVSLKDMPTGTYIVKAGDAKYKFLKK